ncbi:3-hydroxyacyl-CoA dehydrogenase NAD-binding domain-containing protein [Streptomyces sp. R1]|uniref:3-hydroxyacyl-CoA dehydrogenase NAD-binding domain-containing protein n=2 Tax=unclassified Streptomyces TaxID=2593676 RepID=UPI0027E03E08|nr:3-hydroxyacyl-CoA dehydrogenase NAD-binding domain-containing protein [Streptomyces sp. R1]MCC8338673.1 3-hydroxyacyl-CoA dehydrogenase NAD-binding domain-containing protein [Streptomyces sp. R1]
MWCPATFRAPAAVRDERRDGRNPFRGRAGCGLMRSGIAELRARKGLDTLVYDVDLPAVEAESSRIEASLARAVARGKPTETERETALASTGAGVPASALWSCLPDRYSLASSDVASRDLRGRKVDTALAGFVGPTSDSPRKPDAASQMSASVPPEPAHDRHPPSRSRSKLRPSALQEHRSTPVY